MAGKKGAGSERSKASKTKKKATGGGARGASRGGRKVSSRSAKSRTVAGGAKKPAGKAGRKKATKKSTKKAVGSVARKAAAARPAKGGGVKRTNAKAATSNPEGNLVVGGISSEAVYKSTGKHWAEWLSILDAVHATSMSHGEIAEHLQSAHGVSDWWGQMLTVGYEQARGMRQKHEKPGGFEVSASKTVSASVDRAFAAFEDPSVRQQWLADPGFSVRVATASKSMRADWVDGRSRISVNWYARGEGRSQVVVQHIKLENGDEAEAKKAYWIEQLGKLEQLFAAPLSVPEQVATSQLF